MGSVRRLIRWAVNWLYGDEEVEAENLGGATAAVPRKISVADKTKTDPKTPIIERYAPSKTAFPHRSSCQVQIGLDFGTAYCKCVVRDLNRDKAWVFVPENSQTSPPFLIPSILDASDGMLRLARGTQTYGPNLLPHVKLALVKVAKGELDDPVLEPYRQAFCGRYASKLSPFVAVCAVYLLGNILGKVTRDLERRFPGHHPDDSIRVNMDVPVADKQSPRVEALFARVLETALEHADRLASGPPLSYGELAGLVPRRSIETPPDPSGPCHLCPEASAGILAFLWTNPKTGYYILSDTGAATVDQSVFRLNRDDDSGCLLSYHAAGVSLLGSARIEQKAACHCSGKPVPSQEELERFRVQKEKGPYDMHLQWAIAEIKEDLSREWMVPLLKTKQKLGNGWKAPLREARILYVGGGHDDLHEDALCAALKDKALFGLDGLSLERIGMPVPDDFEEKPKPEWMSRLCVAYGLSYHMLNLPKYILPDEVSNERIPDASRANSFVAKEHV